MIGDLMAWLRDQIEEERSLAAVAQGDTDGVWAPWATPVAEMALYDSTGKVTQGIHRHIARQDPRAVLAQCEAHAAILDLFDERFSDPAIWGPVFQALALAYQHCDGYRPEWRLQP